MAYGDMAPVDYSFGDTNFSNVGLTGNGGTGLSYGGNRNSSFGGDLGKGLDQFQDYSSPGSQYGDYTASNFSLGDVFSGANYNLNGAGGSYGLGNNSVSAGPGAAPSSFEEFMNSKLGKLARFAAGFTPLGRVANTVYGLSQATTAKQGVNAAMGMVPGMAGGIARAATSDNPGRSMAQMAGGFGGSAIGGSLGGSTGAEIGGMLGSSLAGRMGLDGVNTQGDKVSPEGLAGNQGNSILDKMGGVGGAANTLAQLYAMSQAGKGEGSAGQGNAAVQQQISQLGNMYGQNSPYAQALRQQLERKDAAAGRRSQYGPREVELQAQLAKMAAGNAQTIGNLATSNQANQLALRKQQEQRRGQQLSTLLSLGKSTGAFNALGSMFGGGSGSPAPSLSASNGSWDMPASNYSFESPGSYGLQASGGGLGLRPSSNSFWD